MIIFSLSPYSFDTSPSSSEIPILTDVPIGAISLLASCSTDFPESVNKVIACANSVYSDFLKTEEGRGFNGQIAIIADSMGSVLAHDALCRSTRHNIDLDQFDGRLDNCELDATRLLTAPASRRKSSSTWYNLLNFAKQHKLIITLFQ